MPTDALLDGEKALGSYPLAVSDKDGIARPLVAAGGQHGYLGRLILEFDAAGAVTGIHPDSGPLANFPERDDRALAPNARVAQRVETPVADFVAELDSTIVATASVTLDGTREAIRGKETNLGNLVADSHLVAARSLAAGEGVDPARIVGVANSGGIRIFETVTGPISAGQTFDVLPFDNRLTLVKEVLPAQLKALMENAVSQIDAPGVPAGDGTGRFAQIAGFTVQVDLAGARYALAPDGTVTNAGGRITAITLEDGTKIVAGGAVVAGAPNVAVATNDFSSRGGDQYPFADPSVDPAANPRTVFPQPLQEIFQEYVTGLGTIAATTNGGAYADDVNQRILFGP